MGIPTRVALQRRGKRAVSRQQKAEESRGKLEDETPCTDLERTSQAG